MISGINHLTLAVRDLDQSFNFYNDVLEFRPLARWNKGAYFLAGESWICLALDRDTRDGPLPENTHVAFSVVEESFNKLSSRLSAGDVEIWREDKSEGRSLYFFDPNGHKLEIHVGDWRSRLEACRANPFSEMIFFD